MVKERISWEEYAMQLAEVASRRSEDLSTRVGSVALRADNTVISIGYNGAPSGVTIDWNNREEKLKRVIHSEQNTLRFVRPNEAAWMVSTHIPCNECIKLIASYNIKKVYYRNDYSGATYTKQLAKEFGIDLIQLPSVN